MDSFSSLISFSMVMLPFFIPVLLLSIVLSVTYLLPADSQPIKSLDVTIETVMPRFSLIYL